jgi:D-alanyl-D-alanine carboxypeptidase (penicillin-binding protein 5/6)
MLTVALYAFSHLLIATSADEYIYLEEPDEITAQVSHTEIEAEPFVSLSADKLKSPYAILYRLKDDTILLQKNIDVKIYPASLTKMVTAVVAIENLTDLKEEIKLNNAMFEGLFEADASMAGFQSGEIVQGIDLLYGALLPSGAECCVGLAVQIAGSEQGFVDMMNQKAAELGMVNTHFENTTGLHDENHYTTVNDLAIFLRYALQNDVFREIFTSSGYTIQRTNKHPDGLTLSSTMFDKLKKSNQDLIGGEMLGGKTGYTDEAGLCLASLALIEEQEYILITTGAEGNQHTEQYNITDALAAYSSLGE